MNSKITVKRQAYLGLFIVTLATLMYEILLTRIFSVTMWYHFAFMAISVAMFGMTVGAIIVYLLPNYFTQKRAKYHLAVSSLLFALSIVVSFLTYLNIRFIPDRSMAGVRSMALTYVVISIPFVFSGLCVCLALTKFPRQLSKLYAADLIGAAVGCILLIYVLKITDGPTAVIVVAFLASVGSVFFCAEEGRRKLKRIALISSLSLGCFAAVHTVLVSRQSPLLRLKWVKGEIESPPLYEKWNSFSRVRVSGDPKQLDYPFGWGPSSAYPFNERVRQLYLNIDATAGTIITGFDGNLNNLKYLKYDVTNLAHYVRPNSKVLVIGTGGGRDILSALAFEQKSVLGIDINENIINTVNKRFGDFTGHLDRDPRVTFVNDEARSYIARQRDKFDIIQVSLIDTWAATAAGAFVLSEHSLYTVEAWKILLGGLNPHGILTFSRWYARSRPGEIYRLTSLASASLMGLGVKNPRDHIVIVRRMEGKETGDGVGTILVSKDPFSDKDLYTIEEITRKMQFDLALSPRSTLDPTLATIASGKDLDAFTARFPLLITPPTDDNPFFFHTLRLRDVFHPEIREQWWTDHNTMAVYILGTLLMIVSGLTFLCIIVPLLLTTKKETLRGALPLFIFFACIGFGFMLVEISQMQRLIIFLGHPTYGLSVVLFAVLLSSGLGSYLTRKIGKPGLTGSAMARLGLLLGTLIIFGILTPHATSTFQGSTTMIRILVSAGILFPIGLFMGMAFPLGMKIAVTRSEALTPWLWGINGATSVCASVVAVAIALSSGISTSFWTGFSCYVVASVAFVWASREGQLRRIK